MQVSHVLIVIEHKDDLEVTDYVAARMWSKDGVKHGSVSAQLLSCVQVAENSTTKELA